MQLAVDQISLSEALRNVLRVVVSLGNYVNGGTGRGQAYGIKLNFLTKLGEIKSKYQNRTLMHFVAETVERGCPESLNLLEDLDAVEKNERHSLGDLEKELKDLRALVNKVALEIEKGSGSPNVPEEISAPFNERLKPFVESAQAVLSDLDNRMATAITKSKEVVKALAFNAENEDDALQELFKLLTTFAKKFKEAHIQNVNAREKKARDERIRLANEKNKKSFRKKKPSAEAPLKPAAPKNKDLFAQFSASRTGDAASIILQTRMQNMQSSNAGLDALRSDEEDD